MEKREFLKEAYKIKDEDIQRLKRGLISVLVVRDIPLSYSSLLEKLKSVGKLQKQDISGDFFRIASGTTMPGIPWHTDRSYHPLPPRFVALYALSVPEPGKGGMTSFCDLQKAYQDMPEDMKKKFNHLQLLHLNRYMLDPKQKRRLSRRFRCVSAVHPLVQSDETGQYLFFDMDYTVDFPLKRELCRYVYQKDYIYDHHWAPFDLVISNNLKTNHKLQKTVNSKTPRKVLRLHFR